jgi:hypothetical protein
LASSAEILVSSLPPDDAGTRTADLYDWQAAIAAADGLRLALQCLADERAKNGRRYRRIICEHHEDWSVLEDDETEIVSAKHREHGNTVWRTLNELLNAGGIAHLYDRWKALDRRCRCRMVTNGGLHPGPAQQLHRACITLAAERRGEPVSAQSLTAAQEVVAKAANELTRIEAASHSATFHTRHSARTPPEASISDVGQFLSVLIIDVGRVHRDVIAAACPRLYSLPKAYS